MFKYYGGRGFWSGEPNMEAVYRVADAVPDDTASLEARDIGSRVFFDAVRRAKVAKANRGCGPIEWLKEGF
jgi:hypothetical protein